MQQITIRSLKQLGKEDMGKDIEWFCESLGLGGERDKNKTCMKIFMAVLNEARSNGYISADNISKDLDMSRTAALHHLSHMKNTGLLVKEGKNFELRADSLQRMVDEIQLDVMRTLKSIREIAEDIDDEMNIEVRKKKQ